MSRHLASVALLAVIGIGAVEILVSAAAYRDRLGADDWLAATDVLAGLPSDEPVYLANDWLGPRARMELPHLQQWAARPDLRGAPRMHVLGLDDAWSPQLQNDLEDLVAVEGASTDAGALTLTTYTIEGASVPTLDAAGTPSGITVTTAGGTCRWRAAHWKCAEGNVIPKIAEVDYRPRRCLAMDVSAGTRVTFTLPNEGGATLRGHAGFDDFNARLRSDAAVAIEVESDEGRTRFVATDEQGWWPFAVATTGQVLVHGTVVAEGTWDRGRYERRNRHVPCLDLRLFGGGE